MGKKTLGTGTAQTLYLKYKRTKKNVKHLKSSKITEGPAFSIVDHSTYTPIPCPPSVAPLINTDVAFTSKVDKNTAAALT